MRGKKSGEHIMCSQLGAPCSQTKKISQEVYKKINKKYK
jgi:hypothetical protein